MKNKKKIVNEGIRQVQRGFTNSKDIEDRLKIEIAKEMEIGKKKDKK